MDDDFFDYYKPIQKFMNNVKKEILSKTNNLYNLKNSRDILNLLFNLFDFQISLMNQIVLFSKNINQINQNLNYLNSEKSYNFYRHISKYNNIKHLMNINKDKMVSLIMKFLSKINSLLNRYKNKLNVKDNSILKNDSESLNKNRKIFNLLNSYNNNSSFLFENLKFKTPIKNKSAKCQNSSISISNSMLPDNKCSYCNYYKNVKKSPKIEKNKINKNNKNNNINNNNNKSNIKDECNHKILETDIKFRDKNKKLILKRSYSMNKDFSIDLNDKSLKNLFNLPIYYNGVICTKTSNDE